jgi:hypothetical protein
MKVNPPRDSAGQRLYATSDVGAASELMVSVDLIGRGFQVFRNVSAIGIDLIAYRAGVFLRVEVSTAPISWDGAIRCPDKRTRVYDILALVVPSLKEISYRLRPAIEGPTETQTKEALREALGLLNLGGSSRADRALRMFTIGKTPGRIVRRLDRMGLLPKGDGDRPPPLERRI